MVRVAVQVRVAAQVGMAAQVRLAGQVRLAAQVILGCGGAVRVAARCGSPRRFGSGGGGG